jgi:hypothetical protein
MIFLRSLYENLRFASFHTADIVLELNRNSGWSLTIKEHHLRDLPLGG